MTKRMRKKRRTINTTTTESTSGTDGGGRWEWIPYNPTNIGSATVLFQLG